MFLSEISSRQHHLLQGDVEELVDRCENVEFRMEPLLTSLNIVQNPINGLYTLTEECSTQQDDMLSNMYLVHKRLELIQNPLTKVF